LRLRASGCVWTRQDVGGCQGTSAVLNPQRTTIMDTGFEPDGRDAGRHLLSPKQYADCLAVRWDSIRKRESKHRRQGSDYTERLHGDPVWLEIKGRKYTSPWSIERTLSKELIQLAGGPYDPTRETVKDWVRRMHRFHRTLHR
jgi:hypothetical protein